MAIKVNGTTVIDDSRNLVNIASGAGSSTSVNAVGTYGFMACEFDKNPGDTVSGSSLKWSLANAYNNTASPTPLGTWRCMGKTNGGFGFSEYSSTVFVRIS